MDYNLPKKIPFQKAANFVKNPKLSFREKIFIFFSLFSLGLSVVVLAALIIKISIDGYFRLSWNFLTSFPSRNPEIAGILSSLVGSFYLIALTALIAIPLGVGAAIYFEKYAKQNWFNKVMEVNIGTLAGIPSIIYGLLGLGLFVRIMNLDRSLLAGALTLSLLILPIIIISSREAIRSVPDSIQDGSFALGATKSHMLRTIVIPLALPGILTGVILSVSRAIGETAPLIAIGALTYIAFLPSSVMSYFTAMPIQIFNWLSRPQVLFHNNAAAGIIVLISITLLFNVTAIVLRNKMYNKNNL